MKSPSIPNAVSAPLIAFCVAALVCVQPTALRAATYTWDGNGNPSLGGNWTETVKWNPDAPTGGPGSADTATLGNTEANRVINYDTGASGFLDTLIFEQTSAFINTLNLLKSLTIAKALTLGASGGGTSELRLANGITATVGGTGLSINDGGLVSVSTNNSTTSAAQGNITGIVNMTGGAITLSTPASGNETRLKISDNFSASGGNISLSSTTGTKGQLVLGGTTNALSGSVTFGPQILISLEKDADQSLSTSVRLNDVLLRGTSPTVNGNLTNLIKTITSSTAGSDIGKIEFVNSANNGSTTLRLGSDLTLNTGAALPAAGQNFGNQGGGTSGTVNFGINTNGFVLDLTPNGGTYTPNRATNASTAITTNYNFTGSGTIRATAFALSTASAVNIGAGTTLEATGATTNNLSGGGTIAATSTFLYSGNAAAASPATLTANRSLGNLTVGNGTSSGGTLRLASNIVAQGNAAVNNGATLDLQNRLSAARITVNTGGTLLLTAGSTTTTDRIGDTTPMTLAGGRFNTSGLSEGAASTPGLGSLTLTSSSVIDLGSASSILAFANSSANTWTGQLSIYNWTGSVNGGGTDQLYFGNTSSGLNTSQLDSITFFSDSGTTSLGTAGILSTGEVVPVPEPSTYVAGMLAVCAAAWSQRRRLRGLLVQSA